MPAELDRAIGADGPLAEAGLAARRHLLRDIALRLGTFAWASSPARGRPEAEAIARYADAILIVPRERFVLPEEIGRSADDVPSPLDREGLATVSAPHAYVLTYDLLALDEGDHLLELGTGTGYGAALASRIVGAEGRVTSVEIDPHLHARAARLLADPDLRGPARVSLILGDATALAPDLVLLDPAGDRLRVAVTFALAEPPAPVLARLPEGGVLVAPVGEDDQRLTRWVREGGVLKRTTHGAVRYVAQRESPGE